MNKLFLALLFIAPTLVNAQVRSSKDFGIDIGKLYPVIDGQNKSYMSTDDGHAIAVKVDGETVFVQRFNSSTASEESRKTYTDFPKYMKMQDLIKVNNQLYFVYEAFNKKEKNFSVYAREIDMNSGSFKPAKTLFKTKGEVANGKPTEEVGA